MKRVFLGLKELIFLFWQDLINFIHIFDKISSSHPQAYYAKALKKDGILIIDNFLSPEECDTYKKQIELLVEKYNKTTTLPNGTHLNFRAETNDANYDHGMIDIFNIENTIQDLQSFKRNQLVYYTIALGSGQKVVFHRINAYINEGVSNTRIYHIDNTQPTTYKAFIYLTDVHDLSYGPYSFIKKSQRFCLTTYLNILRNIFISKNSITDMPRFINEKRIKNAIAPKGTLIISNQNGIHRGIAQETGKKRMALVLNFMVVSKLSYLHKSAKEIIKKDVDN